jgi:hypothetical protein
LVSWKVTVIVPAAPVESDSVPVRAPPVHLASATTVVVVEDEVVVDELVDVVGGGAVVVVTVWSRVT